MRSHYELCIQSTQTLHNSHLVYLYALIDSVRVSSVIMHTMSSFFNENSIKEIALENLKEKKKPKEKGEQVKKKHSR